MVMSGLLIWKAGSVDFPEEQGRQIESVREKQEREREHKQQIEHKRKDNQEVSESLAESFTLIRRMK